MSLVHFHPEPHPWAMLAASSFAQMKASLLRLLETIYESQCRHSAEQIERHRVLLDRH